MLQAGTMNLKSVIKYAIWRFIPSFYLINILLISTGYSQNHSDERDGHLTVYLSTWDAGAYIDDNDQIKFELSIKVKKKFTPGIYTVGLGVNSRTYQTFTVSEDGAVSPSSLTWTMSPGTGTIRAEAYGPGKIRKTNFCWSVNQVTIWQYLKNGVLPMWYGPRQINTFKAPFKVVVGENKEDTPIVLPPCIRKQIKGMAGVWLDPHRAIPVVLDNPVSNLPAVGPAPNLLLLTTEGEEEDEVIPSSLASHTGPGWSLGAFSCLRGGPASSSEVTVHWSAEGRTETFAGIYSDGVDGIGSPVTSRYWTGMGANSRARILYDSAGSGEYKIYKTDGSVIKYGKSVSTGSERLYFPTSETDPQGNTLVYNYDSDTTHAKLLSFADADGRATLIGYDSVDPLRIVSITDPYNHTAILAYDNQGRLQSITDPENNVSTFTYGPGGLVDSLCTPYGKTMITRENNGDMDAVEVTYADGSSERVEYRDSIDSGIVPASESVPTDAEIDFTSTQLNKNNSFVWGRKAYAEAVKAGLAPGQAGFYSYAEIYHWMLGSEGTVAVPSSIKLPAENRKWYAYRSLLGNTTVSEFFGPDTIRVPSHIAGLLPSGTDPSGIGQWWRYSHNSLGKVTEMMDPMGRTTRFEYMANGIDLESISQRSAGVWQTLVQIPQYNKHRPISLTDSSNQGWAFTYNSQFQLETVTNPKSEVTTYGYYSDHSLKEIDGPRPGDDDKITYTWINGLPRTITDSEGYEVTFDYDGLRRLTITTFPDATTEETVYQALHPQWHKDRLNRWTQYWFNSQQELVASMDPLLRMNYLEWCRCGSLSKLRDANGNITQWKYNYASQLVEKTYANGKKDAYAYDSIGRLHTATDALDQVKTLNYFADNRLKEVLYTASVNATPNLSFTYDPDYGRLATVTDGTGTATYSYHPVGTQGALKLAGIDHVATTGFSSYSISRTYDQLGRLLNQTTGGEANTSLTANSTTYAYDELGRVDAVTDPLGLFDLNYVRYTDRLQTLVYPAADIQTNFGYHTNANDQRLEEIENRINGGAVFSKFNYGYDKMGNITTWTRQAGSGTPDVWVNRYDTADQLSDVRQVVNGPPLALQKNWVFQYDPAGNRTSEQVDQTVNQGAYNNLNQLTSRSGGGQLQVEGEINEPGTVTIQSQAMPNSRPATVDANGVFSGKATVAPGSNTLTIVATDASGNARTRQYGVTVDSLTASQAFGYDFNGNMTSRPGTTYEWDAENRLIKIVYTGEGQTEFSYDGSSRRVKAVEKNAGGTVTSEKHWIWCGGAQPCEERDATNKVTKRYFGYGLQTVDASDMTANFFTMRDHLGSTRELVDSTGAVRARYDYDPYGRRTKTSGDLSADYGYTGHYYHERSGLDLTIYRAYDAEFGRWLSRDPIAENGGINLYGYVANNPVNLIDPDGLQGIPSMNSITSNPAILLELGITPEEAVALGLISASAAASIEGQGLIDVIDKHIKGVQRMCDTAGGAPDPNDPNNWDHDKYLNEIKTAIKNLKQILKKLPNNKTKREPVEKAIKNAEEFIKNHPPIKP